MNKIKLTFLFMFVCVVCMFIGSCSVNAETCTNTNISGLSVKTINATNGINGYVWNFDNNQTITFGDTSYLKTRIYYYIEDYQSNSIVSNINLETTCQNWSLENMAPSMTITYADGTRANIAGSTYQDICTQWQTRNVNNNITITNKFEPEISTISVDMIQSGTTNWKPCEIDNNGNITCNKTTNIIDGFRFRFALSKSQSATIKFGFVSNTFQTCTTNTQDIINNQNQNAQQQHNDSTAINNNITNTYNFISSDTIDSNTNTDSISNNYDTTSNNAVLNFMLIPLNFVSSIINGFSSSCSQVCLGDCGSSGSGGIHDFNFRFILPCIDIRSIIGNGIYNTIDALMCIAMIFAFIRSVVGFAKKALLLEADVSSEVRVF